jgi:hypothetical protein
VIVVGAPVHQRGWILREWFDALAAQTYGSDNLIVLLNYGQSDDDTLQIINDQMEDGRFRSVITLVDKFADHRPDRAWNEERYATMVRLRNDLLTKVREIQPDYYLSCDTDMLLPPDCIDQLVNDIGDFEAIAPLTHMTPQGRCPNAFGLDGQRMNLVNVHQVERMFAVFGTVLMTPTMYQQTEYAVHRQGEDIGWAVSAWGKHLDMAIDPHIMVKHVMNQQMLGEVDIRVGF